jgi:hypothetical protein
MEALEEMKEGLFVFSIISDVKSFVSVTYDSMEARPTKFHRLALCLSCGGSSCPGRDSQQMRWGGVVN